MLAAMPVISVDNVNRQAEEQKRAAAKAARDLLAGAKQHGLKAGALKDVVNLRMQTAGQAEKREAREDAFTNYLEQLGMLKDPDPPLHRAGKAARARV